MLQKVKLPIKALVDYKGIIPESLIDELLDLSKSLVGIRVLHLNATSFGGGVAEILQSLVPIQNDLGLSSDWGVIEGSDEFFNVTKYLHNSLQNGKKFQLTREQIRIYESVNRRNAEKLGDQYDIIMIHDPQPAALPFFLNQKKAKYVWRLHIDTSSCDSSNWDYFSTFLKKYDACIFSSKKYESKTIPIEKRYYIPPAIDPLHPKSVEIDRDLVRKTVSGMGIVLDRPLVTQVSRFDPWKDPAGVVKAYRLAKKEIPDLQLALVATMADDDPEGWKIYEDVKKMVGDDPGVFLILNNDINTNDLKVNSIQRYSDVVVQKSLKEGFGLVVAEAMWKQKAVVGGDTVGIRMQIEDGKNGFLVGSIDECAEKMIFLLKNKKEAEKMGRVAKETVREKYLLPRLVRDELRLYKEILS